MQTTKHIDTKKMVTLALLSSLAYVSMLFIKIPIIGFLSYEPKDAVIALAGLLYGPLSAFGVAVVVAAVEMLTLSTTGPFGMCMNILSSAAFACTASYLYHRWGKQNLLGAFLAGAAVMVVSMLGWNYLFSPYYMGVSREVIAGMLVPMFLPFNLIKAGLNTAIAWLLLRPLYSAMGKAQLI